MTIIECTRFINPLTKKMVKICFSRFYIQSGTKISGQVLKISKNEV